MPQRVIWCLVILTSVWLPSLPHVACGQFPRIINGQPTNAFEEVAIVGNFTRGAFCTGTLISPYHVLTAAHCAVAIGAADQAVVELDGQLYGTTQILIHPDYNRQTLANDLAILELDEPVLAIAPAVVSRVSPQIGDELTLVGFGSGGDSSGEDGTFGVKMIGMTTIDDVTASEIVWYFDDPDESNTAPGDSGGPGFLLIGGQYLLAAVVSSGTDPDAALGDTAFNVRVDAFVDWIDTVVATYVPDDPQDEQPDDPPDEQPDEQPDDPPSTDEPDLPEGGGSDQGPGATEGEPETSQCKVGAGRRPNRRRPGVGSANARRPETARPSQDRRVSRPGGVAAQRRPVHTIRRGETISAKAKTPSRRRRSR